MSLIDVTSLPGFRLVQPNVGSTDAHLGYSVSGGVVSITSFSRIAPSGDCYVPSGIQFTFNGDSVGSFLTMQFMPLSNSVPDGPDFAAAFSYIDIDCESGIYLSHDDPSYGSWLDACSNLRTLGIYSTTMSVWDDVSADIRFMLRGELSPTPVQDFWTNKVGCREYTI